jgi:hypothetical protein
LSHNRSKPRHAENSFLPICGILHLVLIEQLGVLANTSALTTAYEVHRSIQPRSL